MSRIGFSPIWREPTSTGGTSTGARLLTSTQSFPDTFVTELLWDETSGNGVSNYADTGYTTGDGRLYFPTSRRYHVSGNVEIFCNAGATGTVFVRLFYVAAFLWQTPHDIDPETSGQLNFPFAFDIEAVAGDYLVTYVENQTGVNCRTRDGESSVMTIHTI